MINRRKLIKALGVTAATPILPATVTAAPATKNRGAFTYCLNLATIRGHNLGFVKELEVASKAGFRSVEIWIDSLETYLKKGGTLADAKQRLNDLGLKVENAIGFATWIVNDDSQRKKGFEQLQREMEMLAQIGCNRLAAPPMGATGAPVLDLRVVAERYRAALDIGSKAGVIPQLEMWGFSKNLSRVSDVMYVALETAHPDARVLLDIFHLYKGSSSVDTLPLISSSALDILHVNDYPANLSPAAITDADRVYPGDGVAPVKQVLNTFSERDTPLIISVEVFNKSYYSQEALTVAKTALAKLKTVTAGV